MKTSPTSVPGRGHTAVRRIALALLCLSGAAGADERARQASLEPVLEAYVQATYSRDPARTYPLLAAGDRAVKSRADHARETGAFAGPALRIARALARRIRLENLVTEVEHRRAQVSFEAVLPNANAAILEPLTGAFEPARLASLTPAEVDARVAGIERLARAGELPMLRTGVQVLELVHEDGTWRVFRNWAGAVEVRFEAVTSHALGWEFEPVRRRVLARPGETVRMAYRARNAGTRETTGKARHVIGPQRHQRHLEIVGCFCFLEQTLAPGEEVELPLSFRIDYDAPDEVDAYVVRYEFYPAAQFPGAAFATRPGG